MLALLSGVADKVESAATFCSGSSEERNAMRAALVVPVLAEFLCVAVQRFGVLDSIVHSPDF